MCAAPAVVLETHGLLAGKKATAHPGFVDKLSDSRCNFVQQTLTMFQCFATVSKLLQPQTIQLFGCSAAEQRVVVDGNLITSRGPGTALEFALAIVEQLYGSAKAKEVAEPMVVANNVGSFMHA